jgi:hypothetical protein
MSAGGGVDDQPDDGGVTGCRPATAATEPPDVELRRRLQVSEPISIRL